MIIAISGTPGCGKTYFAKKIVKLNPKLEYFDLNKYIKENKIYDSYDKSAKTYDVDIKKLKAIIDPSFKNEYSNNKYMDKLINKIVDIKKLLKILTDHKIEGVIIDSHLSHHLKSDYCIIVKTDIKNINKRLKLRKYNKVKIHENIESEIFDICLIEAKKLKRNIILVENN
ncbi:MAG: AAA family ATPase [Candidatus Woesearchaeota archaeon]